MLFQPEIAVTLPHGLWDADGVCHRRATLRALSGREELMLASGADGDPRLASELLAVAIGTLGGYDEIDAALTAALTRGDRHHLALHLRGQLYGDRIAIVARCPNPACRALSDLDLRVSALAPETSDAPVSDTIVVETAEGTAVVREATGEDDAAVHEAAGDMRARTALLWSRLVLMGGQAITPEGWQALAPRTRHEIALGLADARRGPDLSFVARCPSCAGWLELTLDPFALLARELAAGTDRLLAELHCLAYHYHWSEAEALALPRPRRWRYLELIRRELEGQPLVDAQGGCDVDDRDHVGLTRRELERELDWMLRRLPESPQEMLKLLTKSIVMLIDKNNAAVARALSRREDEAGAHATPHQETKA